MKFIIIPFIDLIPLIIIIMSILAICTRAEEGVLVFIKKMMGRWLNCINTLECIIKEEDFVYFAFYTNCNSLLVSNRFPGQQQLHYQGAQNQQTDGKEEMRRVHNLLHKY